LGLFVTAANSSEQVNEAKMLKGILQDFRYAGRGLRKTPVFTAVVVFSVALGIGANTALFSVIDARYLRKLPVLNPDELVSFGWTQTLRNPQLENSIGVVQSSNMSRVTFEALRADGKSLWDVFAYTYPFRAAARIERDPETVSVQLISELLFSARNLRGRRPDDHCG
jgi:hypothetical protein